MLDFPICLSIWRLFCHYGDAYGWLCATSPYPNKHYRGFMLPLTHEVVFSAVSKCKRVLICVVVCIDVQFIVSGRPYPFCRYADKLENEGLDSARLLQSEGFRVKPTHEELVEIAYERCQQQEHGVLCHKGLG